MNNHFDTHPISFTTPQYSKYAGDRFDSMNNNNQPDDFDGQHRQPRQPRIVNIPIQVEGRDGSPMSRSPNQYESHSLPSYATHFADQPRSSPSPPGRGPTPPPKPNNLPNRPVNHSGPRVCEIPIQVEGNSANVRDPSWNSRFMRKTPYSQGQAFEAPGTGIPHHHPPTTEAFETEIPVQHVKSNSSSSVGSDHSNSQSQSNAKPSKERQPKDALQSIREIDSEVMKLESQVEKFVGDKHDKQFKYLDEMLTRCMIKLDSIESGGRDEIRQARKAALVRIEKCLASLESKKEGPNSATIHVDANEVSKTTNDSCESAVEGMASMEIEQGSISDGGPCDSSGIPPVENPDEGNQIPNQMEIEDTCQGQDPSKDSVQSEIDSQAVEDNKPIQESDKDQSNIVICLNSKSPNNNRDICRKKEKVSEDMVDRPLKEVKPEAMPTKDEIIWFEAAETIDQDIDHLEPQATQLAVESFDARGDDLVEDNDMDDIEQINNPPDEQLNICEEMYDSQPDVELNEFVQIDETLLKEISEPRFDTPDDPDDSLPEDKAPKLINTVDGGMILPTSDDQETSEDDYQKSGPTFHIIDENLSSNSSWGSASTPAPVIEFPSDESYEHIPTPSEQEVSS
ncbi:uncharacterized protein LOC141851665 isoform X2 [Brevipalpus obovatus]|uniref:uncharacterized protein LOC141851665 isoform X2 n=1 Tax=Brevipalpus obovatus TaxID=246614 RepID=UPI003D9EC9CD